MNKLKNHFVSSDTASEMNTGVDTKFDESNDLSWNYSLIDIDELSTFVIDLAKETFNTLGAGLPISVYQLKLFNVLTKNGLKLQSAKSVLNDGKDAKDKYLFMVNDVLIVEYISALDVQNQSEIKIKTYLHDNNYAVGLLIEIKQNSIEANKIDQYYTAH